jgi:thioredoxin-like negative regulator of GroEL
MLAKTLDEINTNIPIEVYDIDEKTDIAVEYGIRGVPTLVMLDGNTEMKRLVGVSAKPKLEEWLNND